MKDYLNLSMLFLLVMFSFGSCASDEWQNNDGNVYYMTSVNGSGKIALHVDWEIEEDKDYLFGSVSIFEYSNDSLSIRLLEEGEKVELRNFLVSDTVGGIKKYGIMWGGSQILPIEFDEIRQQKGFDAAPDYFDCRKGDLWATYFWMDRVTPYFAGTNDHYGLSDNWVMYVYDPSTEKIVIHSQSGGGVIKDTSLTYMYSTDSDLIFYDREGLLDGYDFSKKLVMKIPAGCHVRPMKLIEGTVFLIQDLTGKIERYAKLSRRDGKIEATQYSFIQTSPEYGKLCFSELGYTGYYEKTSEGWSRRIFSVHSLQLLEFAEFISDDFAKVINVKTGKFGIATSELSVIHEVAYDHIGEDAEGRLYLEKDEGNPRSMTIDPKNMEGEENE